MLVRLLLLAGCMLQAAGKPQHVALANLGNTSGREFAEYDRSHADRGTDKWLPTQPSWVPDVYACQRGQGCSSAASGAPARVVDGNTESGFVWAGRYNQTLVFDMLACHRVGRMKLRTLSTEVRRDIRRASLHTSDSPNGPWSLAFSFEVASRSYNYQHASTNYTSSAMPPARHLQSRRADFDSIPRGAGSALWGTPPNQPLPENDPKPRAQPPSWSVGAVPNAPAAHSVASEVPPHLEVYSAPLGLHTHLESLDEQGLYTQSLEQPTVVQQARTGGPTYSLGDGDLPMEGFRRGYRPEGHESQFINTDGTGAQTLHPFSWNEFAFNAVEGRYWKLTAVDNYGANRTGFNEIGFFGQECPGVPAAPVPIIQGGENAMPVGERQAQLTYLANEDSVDVHWPAVINSGIANPTAYEIAWRNAAHTNWTTNQTSLQVTRLRVSGLLPYTAYVFRLRLISASTASVWSRESEHIFTSIYTGRRSRPPTNDSHYVPVPPSGGFRAWHCSNSADCNHVGTCDTSTGLCQCDPTYFGHRCERKYCPIGQHNGMNCSANGECNMQTGTCMCNFGYYGAACELRMCPNDCNNQGKCIAFEDGVNVNALETPWMGRCECNPGFYGRDCSLKWCPKGAHNGVNCSGNGFCDSGQGICHCHKGYFGPACELRTCPNNCGGSERGKCIYEVDGIDIASEISPTTNISNKTLPQGKCVCHESYFGRQCEFKKCPVSVRGKECDGKGMCDRQTGICSCTEGYHGPDCAQKYCPLSQNNRWSIWLECNGQGKCEHSTGRCMCHENWYMPDCSQTKCPVSPQTNLICNGKGWCNPSSGLCHCNAAPTKSLSQRYIQNPSNPWETVQEPKTSLLGFASYLTGKEYISAPLNLALIPRYHGPDCSLKRCPVSNMNPRGLWLECNGQGTCDSDTGHCKCHERWYMPNCAKKRCPIDPKNGLVCGGKGWCDSKTGLCECNREPINGLDYPLMNHPWFATKQLDKTGDLRVYTKGGAIQGTSASLGTSAEKEFKSSTAHCLGPTPTWGCSTSQRCTLAECSKYCADKMPCSDFLFGNSNTTCDPGVDPACECGLYLVEPPPALESALEESVVTGITIPEEFQILDASNNSMLTSTELGSFFSRVGVTASEMQRVDSNNDGVISLGEYTAANTPSSMTIDQRLTAVNGSNTPMTIAQELALVFRVLNNLTWTPVPTINSSVFTALFGASQAPEFQRLDANSDTHVTQAEYKAGYSAAPAGWDTPSRQMHILDTNGDGTATLEEKELREGSCPNASSYTLFTNDFFETRTRTFAVAGSQSGTEDSAGSVLGGYERVIQWDCSAGASQRGDQGSLTGGHNPHQSSTPVPVCVAVIAPALFSDADMQHAFGEGYSIRRYAGDNNFNKYLTGTTYDTTLGTSTQTQPVGAGPEWKPSVATGVAYELIPKYHGPSCELKRCPVSNNNRYGVWLECNGQGTCDSSTGRCSCEASWYMPNCAKKMCPIDPKNGKICGGKGWCDSKTGLCECNRDPAAGLEYPVDHYPWYAVTNTRWNNYGTTDVSSSALADSKDANTGGRYGPGGGGVSVVREGDMHSVGQQEVRKAWEAGYAVRWSETASFHRYLTAQRDSLHTNELDLNATSKYYLIPKYHGPQCAQKRCPVSKNNRYGLWLECNLEGTCDENVGRCTCNPGFYGDDCSQKICPVASQLNKVCAGHGACDSTTGTCACTGRWFGADCSLASCPFSDMNRANKMLECNGQGRCDRTRGLCVCFDPSHAVTESPDCAKRRCPVYPKYNGQTCNGHGVCDMSAGVCNCNYMWSGFDCSQQSLAL